MVTTACAAWTGLPHSNMVWFYRKKGSYSTAFFWHKMNLLHYGLPINSMLYFHLKGTGDLLCVYVEQMCSGNDHVLAESSSALYLRLEVTTATVIAKNVLKWTRCTTPGSFWCILCDFFTRVHAYSIQMKADSTCITKKHSVHTAPHKLHAAKWSR